MEFKNRLLERVSFGDQGRL